MLPSCVPPAYTQRHGKGGQKVKLVERSVVRTSIGNDACFLKKICANMRIFFVQPCASVRPSVRVRRNKDRKGSVCTQSLLDTCSYGPCGRGCGLIVLTHRITPHTHTAVEREQHVRPAGACERHRPVVALVYTNAVAVRRCGIHTYIHTSGSLRGRQLRFVDFLVSRLARSLV